MAHKLFYSSKKKCNFAREKSSGTSTLSRSTVKSITEAFRVKAEQDKRQSHLCLE